MQLTKPRWVTTSILTHGLVLALALAITQQAMEKPVVVPEEAILLFVPKRAEPEPPKPQPKPAEAAPRLVIAEPPPKGFQTAAAPSEIPSVIPEIDLTIDDAKAYTKPWTVRVNWRLAAGDQLIEFICNENERSSKHYVRP